MGSECNNNKKDVEGIKLFGATIKIEIEKEKPKYRDDDNDHDHHGDEDLKRPEKIIACPRCKSMETKFCYFNNYNVNQPRHFCKGCQRYWTAGGALRNVPVGAGRRKAKPPCRDYEAAVTAATAIHHFDFQEWHVGPATAHQVLKRRRGPSGSLTCA